MSALPKDAGWCVYILECGDGTLYTGATNDLNRRLEAHSSGKGAKYTQARLPVRMVYCEAIGDRSNALKWEAGVKRLTRKQKLELIANANPSG